LDLADKYSIINRLIDSRNCFELIQRGFVIPSRGSNNEHIRTLEQIVSGDKGGMIISPQIGLHDDVLALDYDSEYANLIVNHNLSYETVGCKAVNHQNNCSRTISQKANLFQKAVKRTYKRQHRICMV
jgi:DNA polymerase elongation subunit (family B)